MILRLNQLRFILVDSLIQDNNIFLQLSDFNGIYVDALSIALDASQFCNLRLESVYFFPIDFKSRLGVQVRESITSFKHSDFFNKGYSFFLKHFDSMFQIANFDDMNLTNP